MASDTKRLTQSEAIEIARKAMDNQERLREKLALSEAVVRDGCEMHTEALDSLTAEVERLTRELDAERHHRINLDVIAKNLTVKCDQQTRALETSRRSVDDWREAWEQKQIELERAEAERDALAAQVAALREAGEALAEYVEHQPFSLARLAAIEAWRAALAAASEGTSPVTTRTITMRCHCGRGVTIGADPWCEGCVQSAATCDCVPLAASSAEGES